MTSDPAAKDGSGHILACTHMTCAEVDELIVDQNRLRERVKELESALQKIANHDGVSEIIARVALSKSPK